MISYIASDRRLNQSDYARIFGKWTGTPPTLEFQVVYEKDSKSDLGEFLYRINSDKELHTILDAFHLEDCALFEKTNTGWDCYAACKRKWKLITSGLTNTVFDDVENTIK